MPFETSPAPGAPLLQVRDLAVEFQTIESVVVPKASIDGGRTTIEVRVRAAQGGVRGNVPANAIQRARSQVSPSLARLIRRQQASAVVTRSSPRLRGEAFGDLVVAERRRQPKVRGLREGCALF